MGFREAASDCRATIAMIRRQVSEQCQDHRLSKAGTRKTIDDSRKLIRSVNRILQRDREMFRRH